MGADAIIGLIIGIIVMVIAFMYFRNQADINEVSEVFKQQEARVAELAKLNVPGEHQSVDKWTERLLREWEQHGKIIIAVDVDDTILPYKTATQKECDIVINLLKDSRAVGAYIILYTCRNSNGIEEAIKYCDSKDLNIDAANKNPPGIDLPWGHTAKPYANIFLDDRAGLQENIERLSYCMYRMRAKKYGEMLDRPGSVEF